MNTDKLKNKVRMDFENERRKHYQRGTYKKLEKQIENVKNDDVFSYILTNSTIGALAHVLELDLVNRVIE